MIDVANKYKEKLEKHFLGIWNNRKYDYWNTGGYNRSMPEIPGTDYNESHFAILDGDNIIGYISYDINRVSKVVSCLQAINFSEEPRHRIIFGVGLSRVLRNIFEVSNMSKITFSMTVGNPIEKSYDKLINRFGGRIVGTYKDDVMLSDGKLYDLKLYEILKSDYIKNK